MPVERGAAPALLPRKQRSGRSWVTVLANYVAAPFSGLVGTGGSKAKAERSRGGSYGPEVRNRRSGAPQGARVPVGRASAKADLPAEASAKAGRRRRTSKEAPIGAPLPHFGEGRKWKEGSAAPQVRER